MATRNCHVTLRSASVRKKSILFIVCQIEVNELLRTKVINEREVVIVVHDVATESMTKLARSFFCSR